MRHLDPSLCHIQPVLELHHLQLHHGGMLGI
jgi:hypothetical protein